MEQNTIQRAGLIAALLCRVIDYHVVMKAAESASSAGKLSSLQMDRAAELTANAERRVAVAIENVIDAGALE